MNRLLLATVVIVLGAPSVALARDHLELVCTGVVLHPKDGGERIALFFHIFDSRADDAISRDQWVSTIYQGNLFQGYHLHKNELRKIGKNLPAAIELKHDAEVRFTGTYVFDNNLGTAPFTLHVVGKINEDPRAKTEVFRKIDETLSCVDLSI